MGKRGDNRALPKVEKRGKKSSSHLNQYLATSSPPTAVPLFFSLSPPFSFAHVVYEILRNIKAWVSEASMMAHIRNEGPVQCMNGSNTFRAEKEIQQEKKHSLHKLGPRFLGFFLTNLNCSSFKQQTVVKEKSQHYKTCSWLAELHFFVAFCFLKWRGRYTCTLLA